MNEAQETKKKRKRIRFHERGPENDIRYKAPLSYRHLRIIAWVCVIISQIGFVLSVFCKLDSGVAKEIGNTGDILKMFFEFMMPLFLIAAFATILNNSKSFKTLLLSYSGASILFYLLFLLFHERYLIGSVAALFSVERSLARTTVDMLIEMSLRSSGYLAFNVFVDLFLCTSLAFFILHRPVGKIFSGKRRLIFRSFAILPILYEVASLVLKLLAGMGKITLSIYIFPALTTKPPMTFVVFVVILLFVKLREKLFYRRRKDQEAYNVFVTTNTNSWQVSKMLAVSLLVGGIIDLLLFVVTSLFASTFFLNSDMSNASEAISSGFQMIRKTGIGNATILILISPLMLFFSYTKTYKKSNIDLFIPLGAIGVIAFIYLEAIYLIITDLGEELAAFLSSLSAM